MTIYEQLKQKNFAEIPFIFDKNQIQPAIDAFFLFLEQPEAIKNQIYFTIAPNHRRGDVGYKHRNAEDHIYNDSKDFFHFHPALIEKYSSFLKKNPIVENFILKAQPIWDAVSVTIRQILHTFEAQFPGISKIYFPRKNASNPGIPGKSREFLLPFYISF